MKQLRTDRLELVPASVETTRAALENDRERFGALLSATIPSTWPPELLDAPALEWTLRWLENPSNDHVWAMHWILLREPRTLIGVAGYKGMPKDGTIELGYGIVAEYQRRGYATEATRAMIANAFAAPTVNRVIAETLPGLVPSIGVLEKCGFRYIGDGSEPGVIRYEIERQ